MLTFLGINAIISLDGYEKDEFHSVAEWRRGAAMHLTDGYKTAWSSSIESNHGEYFIRLEGFFAQAVPQSLAFKFLASAEDLGQIHELHFILGTE